MMNHIVIVVCKFIIMSRIKGE